MPSKRLMIVIVLFVAGAVWGLGQLDLSRPGVPHFPPEYTALVGHEGVPMPAGAGDAAGGPDAPAPGAGQPGAGQPGGVAPDRPRPPPAGSSRDIRIDRIKLTKLSAEKTMPVEETEADDFVVLQVGEDGSVMWDSIETGDYETLVNLATKAKKDYGQPTVIVAPDRNAPWKYVYWVMRILGEAGIEDARLAGYPRTDERGSLLAKLEIRTAFVPEDQVDLPEDAPELVIRVEQQEDGTAKYRVHDGEPDDMGAMQFTAGEYNKEYADFIDKDYSRVPAKSPWLVVATPETRAGHVLVGLDTLRQMAIYGVRLGGDYGPRPK
jgi:biopolymer transport protein ExbD